MVGTHAGDMIGEMALAIGKTIHPHPTQGESIGMAALFFAGLRMGGQFPLNPV